MDNSLDDVQVVFCADSPSSDPQTQPVLVIGQVEYLTKIGYERVKHKLGARVTQDVYNAALQSLHPTTPDTISLYINLAALASLPNRSSRHNCPARPYTLANTIKTFTTGVDETIVVVCPFRDVLASACAVARSYPLYNKKSNKPKQKIRVEFIVVDEQKIDYDALNIIGDATRRSAYIVDAPCNEMSTQDFINNIKQVATNYNLEMTVIRDEELKKKGLNGIYCVGKAAKFGPALVSVKYTPKVKNGPVVAWVGKGIVYDTGGLSMKTKTLMPGMKRDCAGAAAVLGALIVASHLNFETELHAVFCLAENSVSSESTRPDDVETLYSGRTVEINNTDAEGRLVLADGVVYAARDLGAEVILDMATLTGAQAVATGKYHAAVLTNTASLEQEAVEIGRIAGDLVFPIPFAPELHFTEFNSSIADMKNSVSDRANAQSSCAGLFILAHLGFDFSGTWIHVDMAAPAYSGERATGYGLALLTLLFGKYSQNDMIRRLYQIARNKIDNALYVNSS